MTAVAIQEIDLFVETSRARQDDYVVVELVGGVADLALVHRPASERSYWSGSHGTRKSENFAVRMERSFPPPWWPSACGHVERGVVYNRGGSVADAPLCSFCERALAHDEARAA